MRLSDSALVARTDLSGAAEKRGTQCWSARPQTLAGVTLGCTGLLSPAANAKH